MEKKFCPFKQCKKESIHPHCEGFKIYDYSVGICDQNACAWWINYVDGSGGKCAINAISYELSRGS